MFLGAVLTATSVGITARVLRDLGRTKSPEARIILGAAVIDDVLGLVILAVVSGIIAAAARGGEIPFLDVAWIAGKALGFLALAIVLGSLIARHALRWIAGAGMPGALLTGGLRGRFGPPHSSRAAGPRPLVGG